MNWRLLVRPEAERDLISAHDWYGQKRTGLGSEFHDEVAAVMRTLAHHPERPAFYFAGFRRVLLSRFPCKVFYQVTNERVIIFRVLHAKQHHERNLDEK